ncbi:MAG: D-alanine--D-alanine ligase [Planctomycetota bacterium]|nr:D-alanine--D-alanine ligase [Planctomycetota bacterium]
MRGKKGSGKSDIGGRESRNNPWADGADIVAGLERQPSGIWGPGFRKEGAGESERRTDVDSKTGRRRSGLPVVGVLYGGPSAEREVSLASGDAVASALARAGFDVRRLEMRDEDVGGLVGGSGADVAFLALHGEFGEDGQVQAILERIGIPYTGSPPAASANAMDKHAAKRLFVAAGIPTPPWILADRPRAAREVLESGFVPPLVVKPVGAGSSIGVTIVRRAEDLEPAIGKALEVSRPALIETFIAGREFTVGVLDDERGCPQALPPIELVVSRDFYDYTAKYSDEGGTRYICPADTGEEITERLQATALAAHRVLGCRHMSRTDIRMDRSGGLWVLEVNTIPGFTSHSLLPKAAMAAGITFEELCARLVRLALAAAGARKRKVGGRRVVTGG